MATIDDVARLAGVSVATVSRVINNSDAVRKSTADKVRGAIGQLSYTPNLAARNLRRNESRIVMMLAPNFTNPYYTHILSGICDMSRELGYISLVYNTYDTVSLNRESLVKLIEENRVDGTITLGCNKDDEWINDFKDEYPIVQCSEYARNADVPHISVDNFRAANESVNYLMSLGHKRIGFMGSSNDFISTKLRYEGYCKALADAGLSLRSEYVVNGSVDYSFQSGKAAAEKLLSLNERPTAIFCVSDVLALGTIAQAHEMGIDVPEQLSVTGFDDVDYTTMFHPHLTTVKTPCYELGQQAMKMLQQYMQKNTFERHVFLPHEFIERESCAAPFDG